MKQEKTRSLRELAEHSQALPVESWQVVAVERLPGDRECAAWGRDGRRVLEWFDLGDIRTALAVEAWPGPSRPEGIGCWARFKAWLRSLFLPTDVAWTVE